MYVDDNIEEQKDIETDEVKHRTVEMDGEIPDDPLCPGTFPLRQQGECPLDGSENGEHTQQDLLAIDGSPPTDTESD